MSPSGWTMLVGGAAGLALAGFGVRMLVTGRAPAPTSRAFRSVHDAGYYHLLFGVALVLVVVGTGLAGTVPPVAATVAAVVLVGWAMARYRPRGRRSPSQDADLGGSAAGQDADLGGNSPGQDADPSSNRSESRRRPQ